MEAGGNTIADHNSANWKDEELEVYELARSTFRLEIRRWLPIITSVKSWNSLPNKI